MTLVAELRRLLDARARREADLVPRRVLGRRTDGLEIVQALDGECPELGPVDNHRTGSVTALPSGSRFGDRGVAGVAPALTTGASTLVWIEAQDPRGLEVGLTQTVTLTGRGFRDGMSFVYLDPGEESRPNPDVAIDSATFVSEAEYRLEVTVSSQARLLTGGGLQYEIGASDA